MFRYRAQDDQEANAGNTSGHQDGIAQAYARSHQRNRAWIARVLKGHLNYFAVSGNDPSLWCFFNQVRQHWLRTLKRRSQKAFLNWEKYTGSSIVSFPPIRVLHPNPSTASTPEPEGGATCVSSARVDLRRGRGEISVPTATPAQVIALYTSHDMILHCFQRFRQNEKVG